MRIPHSKRSKYFVEESQIKIWSLNQSYTFYHQWWIECFAFSELQESEWLQLCNIQNSLATKILWGEYHRWWHVGENLPYISCISYNHATIILVGFKKYSELISPLLVVEKNNDLLIKNHQSHLTGSATFSEAIYKNYGRGLSHDRGREVVMVVYVVEVPIIILHKTAWSKRSIMLKDMIKKCSWKFSSKSWSFFL